jgi:Mg-chelatase subunit ChlD
MFTIKIKNNKNLRYYSNVPALPNSNNKHLSKAIQVNKKVNAPSKYLSKFSNTSKTNYDIILNISQSYSVEKDNNTKIFNIELNADTQVVKPCTFICILDVSGSMSESSSYTNDAEASLFSRMDLVKHSVNTIVQCLRPEDSLAIIGFNNSASKILDITYMDERGKKEAMIALDRIKEGGGTNLWDGLSMGLNELHSLGIRENHNNFLLLLTDGEPNDNPPKGIYNEFISKISHSPLVGNLHMIGYGYDLDSSLLLKLAKAGDGLFAHVPDYSMCNTVFINLLSNCLATAISNVDMKVTLLKGINTLKFNGDVFGKMENTPFNQSLTLGKDTIKIGPIQSGQQRNILFEANIKDLSDYVIDLEFEYNGKVINHRIRSDILQNKIIHFNDKNSDYWGSYVNEIFSSSDIIYQVCKAMLCDTIKTGLSNSHRTDHLIKTREELNNLYTFVENIQNIAIKQKDKDKFEALLNNIKHSDNNLGQVHKAFSREEWFNRWGIHYLPYFYRSHELEICSNFKDSSLQLYGGKLFKELRCEIEDIFSTIPAPQPSRSSTPYKGNFQQTFYSSSGPCFDGNGKVHLVNAPDVLVKDLKRGHMILNSDGNIATIVCIIKTKVKNSALNMVLINNLRVTPYHPIKYEGKWVHPCTIKEPMMVHCDYIYNFVLDKHHVITINNMDAITLGHGMTNDSVLAHPFFGTSLVIDNLKTHQGWEKGLIEIVDYKPTFDSNGLIASFFNNE